MKTSDRTDAYEVITDQIIAALEAGTVPWRKPWTSAGTLPLSMSSGKAYRGVNVLLLALVGEPYASPYWGTYAQISERGGQVRKGEKSTRITFWKSLKITDKETGKPKIIPMLRYFRVFNADQAEWPEGSKRPETPVKGELVEHDPIAEAEAIVAGFENAPQVTICRSDRAYYVPSEDTITVPELAQYQTPEAYYSVLFHELGHSTGHATRCNRKGIQTFSHFGDEKYSKEELVAEMTAAFLCAAAGIEITLDNSAAYIASWLRVLKGDKKLVVQAAAQAQKAAEHIQGISYAKDDAPAAEKEMVAA